MVRNLLDLSLKVLLWEIQPENSSDRARLSFSALKLLIGSQEWYPVQWQHPVFPKVSFCELALMWRICEKRGQLN